MYVYVYISADPGFISYCCAEGADCAAKVHYLSDLKVFIHLYISLYLHLYLSIYLSICIYIHTYMNIMYVYIYIHICMYISIHKEIEKEKRALVLLADPAVIGYCCAEGAKLHKPKTKC